MVRLSFYQRSKVTVSICGQAAVTQYVIISLSSGIVLSLSAIYKFKITGVFLQYNSMQHIITLVIQVVI